MILQEVIILAHNKTWLSELSQRFKNAKAKYIIIDFMELLQQFHFEDEYSNKILLNIENIDLDFINNCVDHFLEVIRKYYKKDHIILIRTHISNYYVVTNLQPNENKVSEDYMVRKSYIAKLEKSFIRKSKCKVVNP